MGSDLGWDSTEMPDKDKVNVCDNENPLMQAVFCELQQLQQKKKREA